MLLNEYRESLVDTTYPFVVDEMTVSEAILLLKREGLECAPVLHEGRVTAMVTLSYLLDAGELKKKGALPLKELKLEKAQSVRSHEHLFDLFSRMHSFPSSFIPFSEEDGRYAGVVAKALIIEKISGIFHLGDEGRTLELDVPSLELKLSEVIATIEKNDATVLSFGSYPVFSGGEGVVITIRVQTHDLFRLVKNMEKYGYSIRYTSPFFTEGDEELREKALEFIRFMDM